MFDEGLWTAGDDLRVVVSGSRFTESGSEAFKLGSFAGRHLQFAPAAKLRPDREFFRRHRHYHGFLP